MAADVYNTVLYRSKNFIGRNQELKACKRTILLNKQFTLFYVNGFCLANLQWKIKVPLIV